MSKQHARLKGYIDPPNISLEEKAGWVKALDKGIAYGVDAAFDGIVFGFNFLSKVLSGPEKSPDPHVMLDKDGKKIGKYDWVQQTAQRLDVTWANPEWVAKNLHSQDIQAAKLASELSYQGRVFDSPIAVLKKQEQIVRDIFRQYVGPIQAYGRSLKAIESEAARRLKTDSVEDVAQWMIDSATNLSLPVSTTESTPEMLGGARYVPGSHGSLKVPDNYRANTTKLKALDADDIIATAKLILEQLKTIDALYDKAPFVGSGCDWGIWKNFDYDDDYGQDLWDQFYFQAIPSSQNDILYSALFEWNDTMYAVCKWLHSQMTDKQVTLEALNMQQYFDKDKTNPASSDQRAALFGTVDSNWRDSFIDRLKCAHFNPVVAEWNAEAQAQEELVKKTASALVFVFTPKQTGFYGFVEVTALAIKEPKRLFVCFLDDDEGQGWDAKQKGSIDAIKGYLTNECGMTVYTTLETLADAVNGEVAPVSENDTADAEQPQEQPNDDV